MLAQSESRLKELVKLIEDSPQLQQEQILRETYLDIKSRIQSTNAQIERETCKVDNQIQQLI